MKDAILTVTAWALVIAVLVTCIFGFGYGLGTVVVDREILRGIAISLASVIAAILLVSYLVYLNDQANQRKRDKGPCVKEETRYHKRRPYTVCTERGKWVKTPTPSHTHKDTP